MEYENPSEVTVWMAWNWQASFLAFKAYDLLAIKNATGSFLKNNELQSKFSDLLVCCKAEIHCWEMRMWWLVPY